MTPFAPVTFPDLELWLSQQIRATWAARGRTVWVSRKLPETGARDWMVIVRDDGGPDSLVRAIRRVGLRCFTPNDQDANDFARQTSEIVRGLRFTGPLRDVQTSGAVQVDDKTGQPCRYLTATMRVRGQIEKE